MYKIVRIERFNDTVFCDDFKFKTKQEAEEAFTKEMTKKNVVALRMYSCIPYGDDRELTCFTRKKTGD